MKFKLNKSNHYHFFNVLKNIDKINISSKENKQINNDSLIFLNKNNSLFVFVTNSISSAYFDLNINTENQEIFSVDLNLFCNAFHNFPTDEVNFIYMPENNSLIFGNKKTKVSLKTSPISDTEQIDQFLDDNNEYFDFKNLYDSLKCTSFSCSNILEEYPYSSIMLCLSDHVFGAKSSDKHRISIFNDSKIIDKSYLISKINADNLMIFLKELINCKYEISNNKLSIKNNFGKYSTTLENNIFQKTFDKFDSFLENSEIVCDFSINKTSFLKSIKFISSVSKSNTVDFNFSNDQILLSGNTNDKGMVADKITVNKELPEINVSYVENHLVKAIEIFDVENINCEILNYNNYNILKLSTKNFFHLIFPFV